MNNIEPKAKGDSERVGEERPINAEQMRDCITRSLSRW